MNARRVIGRRTLLSAGWLLSGADNSPATGDQYRGIFGALGWTDVPLHAKFFFQLVFCGTSATIVSGSVNERMNSLGFKSTRLMRRVGSGGDTKEGKLPESKPFGLGATTPHEMVDILAKLDKGEIVNPTASKEMLDLMKREQSDSNVRSTRLH